MASVGTAAVGDKNEVFVVNQIPDGVPNDHTWQLQTKPLPVTAFQLLSYLHVPCGCN